MKKKFKKLTAVLLAVVMVSLMIPIATVPVSASQRDDIVSIALNEQGYHGRPNKFTNYFGFSSDWCAMFVTWCARQAGISDDVIPESASSTYNLVWFRDNGRYHSKNSRSWSYGGRSDQSDVDWSYTPQKGDIMLLETNSTYSDGPDHTTLVTDCSNGTLYTVEGNVSGNQVATRSYSLDDSRIWGYCSPAYNDPPNNFPGEEDTSWDVPVWAFANCYSYTYDSSGNREANHHIDEGDYCYVKKVYKNLYALVDYPIGGGEYREAYTSATAFTLYTKPVEPSHWYDGITPVDLGTDFYAQIKNKSNGNLFTKEGNDVNGRRPNGDVTQLWRFLRLDDGSYIIRSVQNEWCLDVEAGDNLLDLNRQPNGTNIQVYGTYNGTDNQKFFIYYLFDSYYMRPVGMEKVVDLGIDSNLVAVWDYAENFAPQKFDIIKNDFNGNIPTNLGENFYAFIQNKKCQKVLTLGNSISSSASDVYGADNENSTSQIWNFRRLSDGSYYITNLENNWYLDVEAGNNINNISEQPDGTNIQTYSTYNGTDNQRFYVYRMFNSYYIRPVGTYRFVDMGINNGLVAAWGYGDDFDPQKFDIIKIDLDGYFPTDLGNDFYAFIKNIKTHTLLTEKESLTANANNVSGSEANGTKSQMWHFIKNNDGSYTIQNEANKMYLDVDAGDNLDNLTAQPNGTNVTTYNKFNGNNNQKFFIYQMFDAYYIKPVGMNRIVDLALLTGDVAVWDYGRDFDPQKFDIVKFDFENMKVGDTTLDGNIDIRDVTAIQKHLAELDPFTEEQLAVADTNGDGEINIADATHLQMYLAEYGVTLG